MARLSPRQRQVLGLIARGRATKEIAAELGIGERTVKWHVARFFERLGAATRAEAVARAAGAGLLLLPEQPRDSSSDGSANSTGPRTDR